MNVPLAAANLPVPPVITAVHDRDGELAAERVEREGEVHGRAHEVHRAVGVDPAADTPIRVTEAPGVASTSPDDFIP